MINLDGICVVYRNFELNNITLDIKTGDYFMLVGPTGSGKTMLLETIAGLHLVNNGKIFLDGRDISTLPPEKRDISIVYQDCALFPHLSVFENIAFGLKIRKIPGDNNKKVRDMAEMMKIEHLLKRRTVKLSGGEKQKVALARSLLVQPKVLLLDEPLSALDTETRSLLRLELKKIHQELGITVIHVTHDFEETLSMGKHAAVIGTGRIHQVGTPEQIFRRPESEFVARFTAMKNIFPGHPISDTIFDTGNFQLVTLPKTGKTGYACIRPDDVIIATEGVPEGPNNFRGKITSVDDRGPILYVTVDIPPEVCCMVTRSGYTTMDLHVGKTVSILLRQQALHLF